eukprot:9372831-Lingulodinium_polyedra.AAC.1
MVPGEVPELNRAGFAAGAFDGLGQLLFGYRWTVDAGVLQTPQAAEFCAIPATVRRLARRARIHTDCLNVQRDAGVPWARLRGVYAAAIRDAQRADTHGALSEGL